MSLPVPDLRPRASGLRATLSRFHRSEQGDEGVNKILIIALIVVPLVVVLIAFGNKIKEWFMSAWESITGKKVDTATDVKED